MKKSILFAAAPLLFCFSAHSVDFASAAYNCAPNHTMFVSGFQRFARLKNSDGDVHTRYNPTAGAIGYIYNQNSWYAGGALSYEHGTRKYDLREVGGNYRTRSDTPGVSVYGGFENPQGWYVDLAGFVGFGEYRMRDLHTANPVSRGNTDHSTVWAASVEGGKNFELGSNFFLTPHIGIDYAYTPSENHYFDNTQNRQIASQDYFEIPLGVSFSKMISYGSWSIIPKVDLTMVNSVGGMDTMNDSPGFVYRTAKSWKMAGVGGDHVGGRITAGVNARLNDRTSFGVDYTYEGRKDYNDHRISAMFGLSF